MSRKDIFTSIVRVKGDIKHKVVPVKSSDKVDISLWKEFSKVIGRIYISTPINTGEIICKNILNTGIDIVCAKRVDNG
ncbi:hypothetical protein BH721_08395 [Clostridium baratii]|uniref:Molybdopterin oxidoreductase, 4Fe-4S cluster-binding subunit n=3 Tax=Clostridium TaxID=1485 RepID=A0A0A7FXQ0_9CLOT|nr:DUF1667 domain-containing protein [Clostridium baratii]AIY84414.1 hypothetical protein U729_1109 [Clostridium baratii str. Sullivan]AQM58751.1 hypothetical protein NPD11_1893 [Clostridium baratii]KJU71838.1 hypothetical protein UC77_06515 [Clostridium baratii]MBS6007742.1 DUF1667 domain-containing protein [Clostridium baratii]MBS6041229.1 DUF1667 domain-containing protein [Clostridium baratii]